MRGPLHTFLRLLAGFEKMYDHTDVIFRFNNNSSKCKNLFICATY